MLELRCRDGSEHVMKPLLSNAPTSPQTSFAALVSLDDVALIRELQAGNDDALAVLYDRYFNAVLGVGLRILRDRGEAEDILQNIFMEIAERVGQFDPARGTVLVWLMQYAYTRSINRRNYLLVRRFYANVAMGELSEFEQGALHLYSEAPQECARFVREALDLLNENQRRTIEMVHFEGLNLKDVAERTRQPFSTVRHHYYRGMAKLKEHLKSIRGELRITERQKVSGMEAGRVEA
jgi:RNA polymerase sigma-70 factor, ECF subfamily